MYRSATKHSESRRSAKKNSQKTQHVTKSSQGPKADFETENKYWHTAIPENCLQLSCVDCSTIVYYSNSWAYCVICVPYYAIHYACRYPMWKGL